MNKSFQRIKQCSNRAENTFTDNDHFSTETFNSLPPHESKKMIKMRRVAMFAKKTTEKLVKNNILWRKMCTNAPSNIGIRKRGLAE